MTRKISRAVAEIASGQRSELFLGALDPKRDWGYAPEYVVAMWRILQLDEPTDLVISTGNSLSVGEFLDYCFDYVGLRAADFVRFDSRYLRPAEVDHLLGDSTKAQKVLELGELTSAKELAKIMVDFDMSKLSNDKLIDSPMGDLWEAEINSRVS